MLIGPFFIPSPHYSFERGYKTFFLNFLPSMTTSYYAGSEVSLKIMTWPQLAPMIPLCSSIHECCMYRKKSYGTVIASRRSCSGLLRERMWCNTCNRSLTVGVKEEPHMVFITKHNVQTTTELNYTRKMSSFIFCRLNLTGFQTNSLVRLRQSNSHMFGILWITLCISMEPFSPSQNATMFAYLLGG